MVALVLASGCTAGPQPAAGTPRSPAAAPRREQAPTPSPVKTVSDRPAIPQVVGKPNVLMVVTDDQPVDQPKDLAQYMPHTARLMRRGVSFPEAIVSDPLCCPSRATAMSGRYPHNSGVTDLTTGGNLDPRTTVQYALQRAGYFTTIVGKYLQGIPNAARPPYFDCARSWLSTNYFDYKVNVDGVTRRVHRYSTTYSGQQLRGCLRQFESTADRRPWYAYWAPHVSHKSAAFGNVAEPEPKYRGTPVPDCVAPGERFMGDKLPYLRNHNLNPDRVRHFCKSAERALISLDDEIARTEQWLRRHDERNTIVIFWSDNGVLTGQHNRIGKTVPYLPSVKVPMFVAWPGHLQPAVDHRLATNVDLTPTILDATGTTPNHVMDGTSLLVSSRRRVQYSESFVTKDGADRIPQWFQLLKPDSWAYIEDDLPSGDVFTEYYDLRQDPRQNRNLLGDGNPGNDPPPGRLRQLHARLQAARGCAGVGPTAADPCP